MKNMRKLFAVTLLVLTLGLPAYAEQIGQMDAPKPGTGVVTQPPQSSQTVVIQGVEYDLTDTTMTALLDVVESILALL